MQQHRVRLALAAVLVSTLAAALVASAALSKAGQGHAPAQAQSSTAILTIEKLFAGLTEFKEGMAAIDEKRKEAQTKLKEVEETLKKLQDDLNLLKDPPFAVRLDYAQKIAEQRALAKARRDTLNEVLQYSGGDLERRIFLKMIKAAESLAKSDGWDVILIDDRHVIPPEKTSGEGGTDVPLTMRQVESIMSQRHIAVASDRVDVTAALVTLMNNEYQSGKR